MRAEFDFGLLTLDSTPRSTSGSVGPNNSVDRYSFRIGSESDINLLLTGMSADADLRLYRDLNGNFEIDANDPLVGSSLRGNANDDSLSLSGSAPNIDAGSYILEVDPVGTASTNYSLRLSNNSLRRPSPLLPNEVEVGTLTSSPRNFTGSVGVTDTSDTFHFAVTSQRVFQFQLSGFSAPNDLDLRLIKDSNGNKRVDSGEVIASTGRGAGQIETINQFLQTGNNYFVQVHAFNGNANYNLSIVNL